MIIAFKMYTSGFLVKRQLIIIIVPVYDIL
jgi:hypothetical protein